MPVDSPSSQLLVASLNGRIFPKATISARRDNESSDYLVIDLEGVQVSGNLVLGDSGGDEVLQEVRLSFQKFTYTYLPLSGPPLTIKYDAKLGKPVIQRR